MASKRLQILQQLETVLEGITQANGFNHDVAEVSRNFKHWTQTENFVRINIVPLDELITETIHQNEDVVNFSNPFSFSLICYLKEAADIADAGTISDSIENLIEDVKKQLYINTKLNLNFVEELSVDKVENYFDWTEQIAIIVIDGHVTFQWQGQNP